MVVIGEHTHPQVLFTGFKDADPAFAAMSVLVPTARLLADRGMNDLRDVDWDIVVKSGNRGRCTESHARPRPRM
jgi:hypothetical protein